jgi:hypothetical protein
MEITERGGEKEILRPITILLILVSLFDSPRFDGLGD